MSSWIESFSRQLMLLSVELTLVALVALALCVLTSRWVSARWRAALCVLALLLTLSPWPTTSPLSAYSWWPRSQDEPRSQASIESAGLMRSMDESSASSPSAVAPPSAGPVDARTPAVEASDERAVLAEKAPVIAAPAASSTWSLHHWLILAWGLGAAFFSIRLLRGMRGLSRHLASCVPQSMNEYRRVGITGGRLPTLLAAPENESPALVGSLRPRLLIPRSLLEPGREATLRYAIHHELAHAQRRDPLVAWLFEVTTLLFWFHPAFWALRARWRRERELACDAAVIDQLGADQAQGYGLAMLDLLRSAVNPEPSALASAAVGRRQAMWERIAALAELKRRPGQTPIGLLACVLTAVLGLPPSLSVTPNEASPQPANSYPSRAEFQKKLAQLNRSMGKDEVESLLGAPDERRPPGGLVQVSEIWCYGVETPGGLASLGKVFFSRAERPVVHMLSGQQALPKHIDDFDESELRGLLTKISLSGSPMSNDFGPNRVAAAVNALLPLGKDRALAVLEEYLRLHVGLSLENRQRVFPILRVLFELPKSGVAPTMMIGAPMVERPKDQKLLPRFPIVLIADLPFYIAGGYMLAGRAEDPLSHIAKYRANGVLRSSPLAPPSAMEPIIAVDEWNKAIAPELKENQRDFVRDLVRAQLAICFNDVHPWGPGRYPWHRSTMIHREGHWKSYVASLPRGLEWSDEEGTYTADVEPNLGTPPAKVRFLRWDRRVDGLGSFVTIDGKGRCGLQVFDRDENARLRERRWTWSLRDQQRLGLSQLVRRAGVTMDSRGESDAALEVGLEDRLIRAHRLGPYDEVDLAAWIDGMGELMQKMKRADYSGPPEESWHLPDTLFDSIAKVWVSVALIDGNDAERLTKLLDAAGIDNLIEGSVAYGVSVPKGLAEKAKAFLRQDAAAHDYWIEFVED